MSVQEIWELVLRELENQPVATILAILGLISLLLNATKRGRELWKSLGSKVKKFLSEAWTKFCELWKSVEDRALASRSQESNLDQRIQQLEQFFNKMREEEGKMTKKIERERLICRFLDASYKLKLPTVREEEIDYAMLHIYSQRIKGKLIIFDSKHDFRFDPTSQWVGYFEANPVEAKIHKELIQNLIESAESTKLQIYTRGEQFVIDANVYIEFFIENRNEITLCRDRSQVQGGFRPYFGSFL